ncbi:alpha/beta fold hydrolase [Pseudomonas panipatensis]|uniref:Pimeloyl-ACP methyl ester carboxylesterase n=1 Tax=Pseudomonas panipatensis TaxID=428992 RepID=A0A1G8KZA0_9PSED|nr:alpha/beta hydrolase [Pseudomonas panipatensis]SDI48732.1 Pimeloyl-ACP methyl ester carboxylesterase [Pseudomonas panipatensis]SMP72961.1 Pimeloyl-ACP methyl ester carboxylesterase [Pseudomonas panipatensis]
MQQMATRQHWINTPQGRLFAQCWSPAERGGAPIVLLHDSLGCVALWRDFPERLAQASGRRVIAYDRLGFGRSDAHPGRLPPSFVEDEARGGFQALCEQLDLSRFVVLGHSVGGGMAVGCAAAHGSACAGLITESAQAFVEVDTLDGIRAAEREFAAPGQLERLRKYHGDKAEWVLRAWVDSWLSEAFSQWNLDRQLPLVRCPLLSLHGDRDEYGSLRHPERITALASGPAQRQVLPDCGHVPHREQPAAVLAAITAFLAQPLTV